MKIFIKGTKGQSIMVEVDQDIYVSALKHEINRITQIPFNIFRLNYCNKCLEDGFYLSNYGICDDSSIDLNLYVYGGSSKIKAMVTEENGEISCSIEETNRIRALLGLKPLNEKKVNKEVEAVENFKQKQEEERRKKDTEELTSKIEKAKNKRLLNEKMEGKKLSTVDEKDESLLSAADWVKQSRIKATQAALSSQSTQSNQQSSVKGNIHVPIDEEDEYNSEHLKGLKVMHAFKDFKEGEEIILTLKDSSILKKDDRGRIIGVAEDDDVLENIYMTEEEKRLDRERKKKRLKQSIYGAYDDEEFNEGVIPGSKPSILSHYDKDVKSGPKFILGQDKNINSLSIDSNNNISNNSSKIATSFVIKNETTGQNLDFYTPEEFNATFKKRKVEKLKKSVRVKKEEDNDDPEDSGVSLDVLLSRQPYQSTSISTVTTLTKTSSSSSSSSSDRGSRKNIQKSDDMMTDILKRKENYDKALKVSEQQTKEAFATKPSTDITNILIQESIERLHRISESKQEVVESKDSTSNDPGARVLELMERQKQFKQKQLLSSQSNITESKGGDVESNDMVSFNELDMDGRRKDGTLVFSSTTEFTARLQALLNDNARSHAEKVILNEEKHVKNKRSTNMETASMMVGEEPEENSDRVHTVKAMNKRNRIDMMEDETMDADNYMNGNGNGNDGNNNNHNDSNRSESYESDNDNDNDDDDDDNNNGNDDNDGNNTNNKMEEENDDQLGFLHKQPLASRSTAAVLSLLKSSGELKVRNEQAGRAKDSRDHREVVPSTNEVKIEYRDEYGRNLTKKEAYRQLCYRFHGYGPGKKKKDKRIKAMELQRKAGTSLNLGETITMKSLERAQEATGKAFVTIQGGVNSTNSTNNASISISALAAQLLAKAKKKKETELKKKKKE